MLPSAVYRFVKDEEDLEEDRVAEEQQDLESVELSETNNHPDGVDPPCEHQDLPVHSHPCLQALVSDYCPIALCEGGSDQLSPSLFEDYFDQSERGEATGGQEGKGHDR
jgi:hypothetical protein